MPYHGRKKTKSTKPWSLFPAFHEKVVCMLEEDHISLTFNSIDDGESCTRSYDTHVMGRFKCHNPQCNSDGWSSKKIAITIRMYPEGKYNARVYHQRCKGCNRLSRPVLDESYADRVVYRIKKWHGIDLEQPFYSKRTGPPHDRTLCEGCKDGHCTSKAL
jgi:hypothetical protein